MKKRVLIIFTLAIALLMPSVTVSADAAVKDISTCSVTVEQDLVYTGSAIEPEITVKDGEAVLSEDCYQVAFSDNTDAGEAVAAITGIGEYTGMQEVRFTILPAPLQTVSVKKSIVYGSAMPVPSVTGNEMILQEGVDYTVFYLDNADVGTAVVEVSGCGNYTGTLNDTFSIVPQKTKIRGTDETDKKITIKWRKQAVQTDGYQIQYALDRTFEAAKTVTVKDSSAIRKNVTKIKKGKYHYIRIRAYKSVDGIPYYSAWSKTAKTDGFITVPSRMRGASTIKKASIFKKASKKAQVLKTVPFASKVRIKKQKGNWCYATFKKSRKTYKGYISKTQFVIYDKNKKHLALTFDDGPGLKNGTTNVVLNALEKNGCRATFFLVGSSITDKTKSLIKREKSLGCELGNHSFSHPKLSGLSADGIRSQLGKTDSRVKEAAGSKPTVCRAPYGSINASVLKVMKRPHILWSVDTLDWKHRNTSQLISYVKAHKKDGAIILMHDIHPSTAKGIDAICRDLVKSGYETVTVTELAAINGQSFKNGVSYNSFYK